MTVSQSSSEAFLRGARMLRTALGPAIAGFLEDPSIAEVMLNPDGRLWIDRLSGGLEDTRLLMSSAEDSLKVQAGVVGNIPDNGTALTTLVTASQSASGALQAAQAGNQLLALQSQQLSDLAAVLAAKGRADALEQARGTAAEAQGQEQYRRFSTRSGYQPGGVTMFHGQ